MKYKYIVGLLVALSLNNAFAAEAEEPIAADDYQNIYHAFRCGGVKEINTALASNKTFNHKDDTDIIRSSQTGLALRKAVIGLNAADLQAVVENNHEFFKTSLGVSLVYGWTLNQFKEPITPYYIGYYFSFDRLFLGMASKMANAQVSTFLKRTFTLGLRAVEDDRWAFYDHMLYLPYAIEQVGIAGHSDLSIDDVIRMSRRTKEDAKAEKQALTIPMLEFDDSRDGDGDDLTLDKASYLTEIPGTYNKEQYYNDVKDLFLTDSVTAETFKKLQFFCHNTAGLDNIGIFLCSMNVDVDAKPIQLGTKVRALSNKRWFDGQTEDIITLREICAPVLEAIKGDLDFEKERAAAAEEREKEEKRQQNIINYNELYQVASTFKVGNTVPENIESIKKFAVILKKVLKMDEANHTTIQSLTAGMALENGKKAEKFARANRKAALSDFVTKVKALEQKYRSGESAYAK